MSGFNDTVCNKIGLINNDMKMIYSVKAIAGSLKPKYAATKALVASPPD